MLRAIATTHGKVVTKEIQVAEYESVHMGSQPNRNGNLFQSKKKSYKTTLAPTFYYTQSDKASLTITTDDETVEGRAARKNVPIHR